VKEHYDFPQSAELVAELDAVARHHGSREQAFDDLLTLAVCALAGQSREEEYLKTVKPYVAGEPGKRPIDRLVEVFGRIVVIMKDLRTDILGDIFQGAITRGQNQQFFTPSPICELMARLTDEAQADNGNDGERESVCDPSCGSGRILLAAATVNRNRYFVGQDIDHRCAKITAINLALWNLYGKVIWGNTLTDECRRVYHTGFNGTGFIHIEEVVKPEPEPEPMASPPAPVKITFDLTAPVPKSHQPTLFDDRPS